MINIKMKWKKIRDSVATASLTFTCHGQLRSTFMLQDSKEVFDLVSIQSSIHPLQFRHPG